MRYRKIDPRIWNDAKFREMSDAGKLSFFLLLTHPRTTAIGTLRASPGGLESDLKGFAKGFGEPLAKGLVKQSRTHPETPLLFIPNFLKHNPPENPNCVKAWKWALDEMPECDLYYDVIKEVKRYTEGLPEGFAKGLPEGFAKPWRNSMPNPEPEPEPEQEHTPTPAFGGDKALPRSKTKQVWDEDVERIRKAYPRSANPAGARKAIQAAIKNGITSDALYAAVVDFASSPLVAYEKTRDGGKWIPHCATWINGKRWEEDRHEWQHTGESRADTNPCRIHDPAGDAYRLRRIAERQAAVAALRRDGDAEPDLGSCIPKA